MDTSFHKSGRIRTATLEKPDSALQDSRLAEARLVTEFVIDAAVVEAERVLADRTQFVLDADQWERFVELLDRPPQEKPGPEKLFSQPSVFTGS